jgi:hypothetical protein
MDEKKPEQSFTGKPEPSDKPKDEPDKPKASASDKVKDDDKEKKAKDDHKDKKVVVADVPGEVAAQLVATLTEQIKSGGGSIDRSCCKAIVAQVRDALKVPFPEEPA